MKSQYKLKLLENNNLTYEKILVVVEPFLYKYVEGYNVSLVNTIALEVKARIPSDTSFSTEFISDSYRKTKDKLLELFSIVRQREILEPGYQRALLDVLINLDDEKLAEAIREKILSNYGESVNIYVERDRKTLVFKPNPYQCKSSRCRRKNLIMYTLTFVGICALIVFSLKLISANDNSTLYTTREYSVQTTPVTTIRKVSKLLHKVANTEINIIPHGKSSYESEVAINISGSAEPTLSSKKKRRTLIKAKSIFELQNRLQLLSFAHSIWIEIDLVLSVNWPYGSVIPLSTNVSGLILRGHFYTDIIFQILNETKNLKILHLINNENLMCRINEGQLTLQRSLSSVSMDKLKFVILEEFATCSIYSTIASKLETKNLEGIQIKAGEISSTNYLDIMGLLHVNRLTITDLSLHQTMFSLEDSKVLFDTRFGNLPKLQYLHVDFIPSKNVSNVTYFGVKFPQFVPNLEILTSDKGLLPWSQVPHFLECKKLRRVKIAVEIPDYKRNFSFTFLNRSLPMLVDMTLGLYRKNCKHLPRNNNFLRLEGIDTLPPRIKNIKILSNCMLSLETTASGSSIQNYRNPYYFMEKNLYGIKFEIDKRKPKPLNMR